MRVERNLGMMDKRNMAAGPIGRWVDKACEQELPVLSATLGQIDKALDSEEYSTFALARVILQDPPLTAKVLRVANSVYYNPNGHPISMVSRAVLVLGFESVRSICTSIAVTDALLRGPSRQRLLDEIARALFAAVIARRLAQRRHDPAPEEVFVATMLRRLGHMVFWSLDTPEADELDEALRDPGVVAETAESRIVGFSLARLSDPISERWGLPTRLSGKGAGSSGRIRMLETAWDVAEEAARGWSAPGMQSSLKEMAWHLSTTESEAKEILIELADETARFAGALGSEEVAARIPFRETHIHVPDLESDVSALGEIDTAAENRVLAEISGNLLSGLDVNSVLEMVLEGIHRGVGMDRTALAFLDPRTGEVRCRHALGVHRRVLLEEFHFAASDASRHVLVEAMEYCRSVLVEPGRKDTMDMLDHPVYALFEGKPFLAQPVSLRGKAVGLFVADRHESGRPMERETWDRFRLLVRQADVAMALAASGRSG